MKQVSHHRCTKCKEESYPRHKYQGGVYCNSCIKQIRGFRPHSSNRRGWFRGIWDKIRDLATFVFQGKRVRRIDMDRQRVSRVRYKAMESRARGIPLNPEGSQPQKR